MNLDEPIVLEGVREHNEHYPITLYWDRLPPNGDQNWNSNRLVLRARNEGGFNDVNIDFEDLMNWIAGHLGLIIAFREACGAAGASITEVKRP